MKKKGGLQQRTKPFALQVIRLVETLPKDATCQVIGRQLLRSATSVGANYRAAARARSTMDFVAKMKIIEEECDETLSWMELLLEAKKVTRANIQELMDEGNELLSMTVASIKTARKRGLDS